MAGNLPGKPPDNPLGRPRPAVDDGVNCGLQFGMITKWDAAEHLRTREDARLYLEACAEEDPGDGSLIRAALNDVARTGNMSGLARDAGMSREGLYKALSANGNPTFATVMRIATALGLRLRITAGQEEGER